VKRSALRRRVGLRRTGWLRRRVKPASVIAADIWREGLGSCMVCRFEGVACRGPVQGHHIISRQTLRRLGFHEHLLDRRNRLAVCEHRHEQHTSGFRPIPRRLLPGSVFEFAAELGLGWWLDRYYPFAEAA
jgi:hypothetical protein